MNKYDLTVIIPTRNRKQILKKSLESLTIQKGILKKFEVIVIDDVSNEPLLSITNKFKNNKKFNLKLIRLKKHMGASYARNIGIKKACGKLVLFIGDDIIASEYLIKEHIDGHNHYSDNNYAILGYITWDKSIRVDDFQKWLEKGTQSNYESLQDNTEISYIYLYTTNCSFKKEFLLKNGLFNNNLKIYFEDLELAYRLKKRNLKIIYLKNAKAYHHHKYSLNIYIKRMILTGKSAYVLLKIHPELKNIILKTKYNLTHKIRKFIDPVLYFIFKKINNKKINYRYYSTIINSAFYKGYKEAHFSHD